MIKYKKYLDQFGWPIKTLPNFKIKKKYEVISVFSNKDIQKIKKILIKNVN